MHGTLAAGGKYFALALVSGGVLALQITFTRIFSLMIWHHFTYLVIGVALLGGGAAGTFLAVHQWDRPTLKRRLGLLALSFGMASLINLVVIRFVAIDPLRAAQLPWTIVGLAIYFACLFTTFFTGGLTIAAAFSHWSSQAHKLYFADMLGAGIATVSILAIIELLGGPASIALISFLGALAAVLFGLELPYRLRRVLPACCLARWRCWQSCCCARYRYQCRSRRNWAGRCAPRMLNQNTPAGTPWGGLMSCRKSWSPSR